MAHQFHPRFILEGTERCTLTAARYCYGQSTENAYVSASRVDGLVGLKGGTGLEEAVDTYWATLP